MVLYGLVKHAIALGVLRSDTPDWTHQQTFYDIGMAPKTNAREKECKTEVRQIDKLGTFSTELGRFDTYLEGEPSNAQVKVGST